MSANTKAGSAMHTAEPWELRTRTYAFATPGEVYIEGVRDVKGDNIRLTGFSLSGGAECEANTARIVACVNAMAGLSNEQVESLRSACAELRSALTNATEELSEVVEWALTEKAPLREQEIASIKRVTKAARAVLANAKE